ncbi:MAG: sigma-70 family RNA polymerase sigma factor [Myxococcales bacterium]|nr:MAG: sigma-70 family RNA polymerase sigma factor [Myxococcales bacterium]
MGDDGELVPPFHTSKMQPLGPERPRPGTGLLVPPAQRAADPPPSRVRGRPQADTTLAFAGSEALVAGLQRGQPEAKAAFFDVYEPHARRLLLSVLGPDRELPDILHEAFVSAFRSVHKLREPSALGPWFARVTVYTARKALRARRRRAWLRLFASESDEAAHEPLAAGDADTTRAVAAAYEVLGKQHPDEQVAFALHYVQGMTLAEVAEACELSLSTVKRRVKRARAHFLAAIGPDSTLQAWTEEEP